MSQPQPAPHSGPRQHVEPASLRYAVVLEPDEDSIRVIVPAFPEINTFGSDRADALRMACEAIALSLEYRRDQEMEIPPPDGETVRLDVVSVAAP